MQPGVLFHQLPGDVPAGGKIEEDMPRQKLRAQVGKHLGAGPGGHSGRRHLTLGGVRQPGGYPQLRPVSEGLQALRGPANHQPGPRRRLKQHPPQLSRSNQCKAHGSISFSVGLQPFRSLTKASNRFNPS